MNGVTITPELVSRLVADQFPQWAHLPVRPVTIDGWDNATFRLGDALSVRLPSGEAYAAQVEKEHLWLPLLARELPLAIPEPLARGVPAYGFPWPWSVYRWLPGESASVAAIDELSALATALAEFLSALYEIDPAGGPTPGEQNFHRGGSLAVYDEETRQAIRTLDGVIDSRGATEVWEAALAARWDERPVWVHGDVAPSNLLVSGGRLSAVIDFGCSAVGDPACDLAITWTFLTDRGRHTFRKGLSLDDATWARGRGWALWKALITLSPALAGRAPAAGAAVARLGWRVDARHVVEDVIDDHRRTGARS